MAQTYTISTYQQLGNAKSMLTIWNGVGSGRVIRLYKTWAVNHANVAATGTLAKVSLYKISASSGGTDIKSNVVKHQSANESMPSQVTITHSSTDTTSNVIRQIVYVSGTSATAIAATYTIQQWASIYSLSRIMEVGYYNSTIEPIVIREGQGVSIKCVGTTTNGFMECAMEFTLENT